MHKYIKTISIILTLILIFSILFSNTLLNVSADETVLAYVTGTNVRVRSAPKIEDNNILDKVSTRSVNYIDKLDVINSQGKTETWYYITYHNGISQITGYIHGNYIKITTYNPDISFEEKLLSFPQSYREPLRLLKSIYPNWEFIPEQIDMTFEEAVYAESINMRKQVSLSSQPVSWRSMGQGSYDWNKGEWINSNGGWTGASREIIAYYMDPRNFLNATSIYQFLNQSYNSATQTEQALSEIIAGTFLANDYPTDSSDPYAYIDSNGLYKGSYKKIIMDAAIQGNISPIVIASKIIQEQGVNGTSDLISGEYSQENGIYFNYYNFFNIGAYGSNTNEVIRNGLQRAKNEGWTTRATSIIGGAKFLAKNYIAVGQDTYYYQDFNVKYPDKLYHQYAQAIHDAYSKGENLAETYKNNYTCVLDFKIPVFLDMPESACEKPASNDSKNNYYASSVLATGLTPSFNMYTYNYDLHVSGNTVVYVTPVSGATFISSKEYNLTQGSNSISIDIKSETGFVTSYHISVNAESDCILRIALTDSPPSSDYIKSDINCDSIIAADDLALLKKSLISNKQYNEKYDINSDAVINILDLIRMKIIISNLRQV